MTTHATNAQFTANTASKHRIAKIDISAPAHWLRKGVEEFLRIPALSLLYGFLFAGLCGGVFLLSQSIPWYTIGYLTGLVVLGPFLAAGLYVASRDLERGTAPSIDGSLRLLGQRKTYLALFSLMLALVMAAWVRFSALLFAIKFNTLTPSVEAYLSLLGSSDGWITLSFFVGIGLLLAVVVFTVSAVAIPLILDKDVDFITAIQTSYRAVVANVGPMALWALSIVVLTFIGVVTAFIGFAVLFPILGYATWHSYRALVR